MSARSLTAKSLPCRSAAAANDLEKAQLVARLEALLPQLDDVHAAGKHRVEEVGQITLALAGVGAQIEPGLGERGADR